VSPSQLLLFGLAKLFSELSLWLETVKVISDICISFSSLCLSIYKQVPSHGTRYTCIITQQEVQEVSTLKPSSLESMTCIARRVGFQLSHTFTRIHNKWIFLFFNRNKIKIHWSHKDYIASAIPMGVLSLHGRLSNWFCCKQTLSFYVHISLHHKRKH